MFYSGNKAQEPAMACHCKVVLTNWLERGSASSAHVEQLLPGFLLPALDVYAYLRVGSFFQFSAFAGTAFLAFSILFTLPLSYANSLFSYSTTNVHPYINLSFWQAAKKLDFLILHLCFCSASFCILYVSSTSSRYFSAVSVCSSYCH